MLLNCSGELQTHTHMPLNTHALPFTTAVLVNLYHCTKTVTCAENTHTHITSEHKLSCYSTSLLHAHANRCCNSYSRPSDRPTLLITKKLAHDYFSLVSDLYIKPAGSHASRWYLVPLECTKPFSGRGLCPGPCRSLHSSLRPLTGR